MGKRSMGNYFSFRWMITPDIIKIVFVIGFILLDLSLIGSLVSGIFYLVMLDLDTLYMALGIGGGLIVTILLMILLNLIWRMMCEYVILFFSIHEILSSIEGDSKNQNKDLVKELRSLNQTIKRVEIRVPPPPPGHKDD